MSYRSSGPYRALGYRFEVLVEAPLEAIGRAFVWAFEGLLSTGDGDDPAAHEYRLSKVAGDGGPLVRIDRDGQTVRERVLPEQALNSLMTDVNAHAIASRPGHLNVHAGVVARDGVGVVLSAESGSGKSTLTGALVSAGCGYLTDEAASIDLDARTVEPYAKPLSLSLHSMQVLGCPLSEHGPLELLPGSWLRADPYAGTVTPGVIVFPRFEDGAGTTLTAIGRGEALVELANNSFNFVDHGGGWLPHVRDIVAGCTCWRLVSGDAFEAARLIMEKAA